jgi:PAS domain S-box-containing protein
MLNGESAFFFHNSLFTIHYLLGFPPMNKTLKILHLEDDVNDAELVEETLRDAGVNCEIRCVQNRREFLTALDGGPWDLILADYTLPSFDGLSALKIFGERELETPFIFVTGALGEDRAVEVLKCGATDYVLKNHLPKLPSAVKRALREAAERRRRRMAEEALRASERRHRRFVENNAAGVLRSSLDGDILDCNHSLARMLGYDTPREFKALRAHALYFHPSDREVVISRLRKEKLLINQEVSLKRKDGRLVWALANISLVEGEPQDEASEIIEQTIIDITERKRVETQVYESRQMLRLVLDNIPQRVYWKDRNSGYVGCNRAFATDAGLTDIAGIVGTSDLDLPWMEDAALYRADDQQVMEEASAKLGYEQPQTCRDGSTRWLRTNKLPLRDPEGTVIGILGTYEDITERKEAEAEIARLAAAIEQAAEAVYITDVSGSIQYINPAFTTITGYSRAEALGKNPRLLKSGKHDSTFYQSLWTTILAGQVWHGELTNRRKDGTLHPEELSVAPIRDSRGQITNFVAIVQDITDRKRAEEGLRASLHQKELLLKEVHHRVKNNLQVISSLLTLQSGSVKDQEVLGVLKESESRIRSMALIHQKLYSSDDLAKVDFAQYVASFVVELFQTYSVDSRRIASKLDLDKVVLDVDTAVPCGLILNELVVNCLKHAFKGGQPDGQGEITIELRARGPAGFVLTVRDNGAGLPKDLDISQSQSLGLRIVCGLADQLRGTIEHSSGPGTEFKLTVPAQ